jgi:cobalt-zinc-cadmium efflux system outer membrane protein
VPPFSDVLPGSGGSGAGTGGGAGAVVLQALQQRSEAAATDEDAANRRIIPDLVVGGGPSLLQTGSADMSVGYLVTVGIELPVFDRGQGDAARARGERRALDAERDVVSHRLDSARAAAHRRAVSAHTRSEAFAAAVVQARGLFDAAAADFGVGSGDVVAFVDAAAAVREARLHLITVQADAARADVDLALVNGALGAPSESTP